MNVDLSSRDIELILMMLSDAAEDEFDPDGAPLYSMEELELIQKLESALRKAETIEKDAFGSASNNIH